MKEFVWRQTARTVDIRLDWPNIETAIVKAGTPVSAAGAIANTAAAVGILASDAIYINAPNANRPVTVIVGGVVMLSTVEASSGLTLTDAAKAAMKDITFIGADGSPDVPKLVPVLDNIADSTATTIAQVKTDLNALLTELKAKGLMAADPEPEPEPGEGGDGSGT